MKKALVVVLSLFYIACAATRSEVSVSPRLPAPESQSDEILSYYNEAMDVTLLMTEVRPVRYRVQPPTGNPTASLFVSMSAVHQTHRLTQTPTVVSFNVATAISDIPPILLLINVPNGRWIKVEPEIVNGVYVSVIPLTAMETFLDSEHNGVVGFMGGETRFLQFAVNDSTLQLFKRFMNRLHQTSPATPPTPPLSRSPERNRNLPR